MCTTQQQDQRPKTKTKKKKKKKKKKKIKKKKKKDLRNTICVFQHANIVEILRHYTHNEYHV